MVGAPFSIVYEVKRPKSLKNLGNPVKDARTKVQTAIKGSTPAGPHPVGWGCVVLVMDHLLPQAPAELRAVVDEWQATVFLHDTVERWRQAHEDALLRGARDGVAGCWLWWRPYGRLLGTDGLLQPTEFHQVKLMIYPTADDDARELLESRRGRIQAKGL